MFTRGIVVVAITRVGVETALKIKKALANSGLTSAVYAPKKYCQNGVIPLEKGFADFFKESFHSTDALVGVTATGIIIRAVAPYLESKLVDPAVIGVDATGKFIISLLSGHYGGANELTKIIAEGIGGTAVITTATDVTGKLSVDDLARCLHLSIQNPESLVAVNSAVVNGDHMVVVLLGDVQIPTEQVGCYEIKRAQSASEALEIINGYDAGAIVTGQPLPRNAFTIDKVVKPFTILKTKRIVVGLGARKESSAQSIVEAVEKALEETHLLLANVERFATVDIKRDSPQMIEAADQLGKPLDFLSVEALRSVNHKDLSPDSEMVQRKIGVGGVCERAAILKAGKTSKLILKKTKLNGVTVAIAEGE
jgi:cobalt-precorrin 5A hydrolase